MKRGVSKGPQGKTLTPHTTHFRMRQEAAFPQRGVYLDFMACLPLKKRRGVPARKGRCNACVQPTGLSHRKKPAMDGPASAQQNPYIANIPLEGLALHLSHSQRHPPLRRCSEQATQRHVEKQETSTQVVRHRGREKQNLINLLSLSLSLS